MSDNVNSNDGCNGTFGVNREAAIASVPIRDVLCAQNTSQRKSLESKVEKYKVAIIGGGCAGLTAAIYAGRAQLDPILFSGETKDRGGLLVKTSIVENFPGFENGIMGYDLMENMFNQAKNCGATIKDEFVTHIEQTSNGEFVIYSNNEEDKNNSRVTIASSIIVATGSVPNKLNIQDEEKFWGKGISSCAVCDGVLYKKKRIFVVGGGDSAMEEALFLTKFSNVTIIHRRDSFRASAIMQKRVLEHPKINILYNSRITKLIGENDLKQIEVTTFNNTFNNTLNNEAKTSSNNDEKDLKPKEEKVIYDVDGLFYGLGLTPSINTVKNIHGLHINNGHIKQVRRTQSSIPGLFVAGDVTDDIYRQAIVACADGCKAAMDACEYLNNTISTK